MTPPLRAVPRRRSVPIARGAASLVVVMVLFFIITLVAAYTSRNLIFEQRTSANQYRSTLAFEAADAGIEWALARLNGARMNNDCTPLATPGSVTPGTPEPSFRERYLTIDATTGAVTPVANLLAGCVYDGAAWVCDCPAAGNPNPTYTPTGAGPFAAFWVRFVALANPAARPGAIQVQVNSCTRPGSDCLRFDREAASGDGISSVWQVVALKSALTSPPSAALTARDDFVRDSGTTLTLTNTDAASGGYTLQTGASVSTAGTTINTLPGTPPQRSIIESDPSVALPDLSLTPATPANTGTNRMFASVFGMWPTTYLSQPAVVVLPCTGGCDASDVNDLMLLYPHHAVHVSGGGRLRINADLGTATGPAVVIVDGDIEFTTTAHTVFGLVYSRDSEWRTAGTGTIQGAAIAEQRFRADGSGPQTIVYDADVIRRLRMTKGSFTKVPGGWRDFNP